MKKQKFKFIDLFCGIGGFRYALEEYNGDCVFSSDWDKHSQLIYEANFGEIPHGDITQIEAANIPEFNVLCAGFPCQAFSISGKRQGFDDTRGTLFFDVARIASYHKPEVLFLENVKNLAKHDNGKTLEVILQTLDNIGYDVYHKVLNASQYGVPQSRQRVYFVGFRKDLNVRDFSFPKPTLEPVNLSQMLDPKNTTKEYIINRNDISIDLKHPKLKKDIFGNYPLGPIQIGKMNKGGQGERIYSPLGHAITFSAYGGGPGGKTGAYYIDNSVRKLSPKECARVMGYPEDLIIPVSKGAAYKLFGNSVIVPVLKLIFAEIDKKLKLNKVSTERKTKKKVYA